LGVGPGEGYAAKRSALRSGPQPGVLYMRELSQHIMDLVENSVQAGARRVDVEIQEDLKADVLTLRVIDDGHGMAPEIAARVTDPFFTSRTCRRIGLGLPLMAAATERCGGSLEVASTLGRGTVVTARFQRSHIDRPPLGDLRSTLLSALVGHPAVDFHYRHSVDGRVFDLDGAAIKRELGGVPLTHPAVLRWLEQYLGEGLAEVGVEPTPLKEEGDA